MEYKVFGKTGKLLSRLGFGAMRLPGMPDDDSRLDIDSSVRLLRKAFDLGVNYVDTAYIYRGGQSEEAVGEALKGIGRKIYIGTKFPLTDRPDASEYRRKLETSLRRMHLEQIDFYYFHAVGKKTFDEVILQNHLLKEAEKAKEEGLIRHISFSFHDEPEQMRYIIERGELFESVLCQYNILHRQNDDMMAFAKEKGLGVAVMGPLAGGKFMASEEAARQMGHDKRTGTAEIGLRFVYNNPHVDIVLSGMKNMEMLEENAQIASQTTKFTAYEQNLLEQMIKENQILGDCYCTECCYCLPCPMGINIPYMFRLLNLHKVDRLTEYARKQFAEVKEQKKKEIVIFSSNMGIGTDPGTCASCGKCKEKCPQKLDIPVKLQETIQHLGQPIQKKREGC